MHNFFSGWGLVWVFFFLSSIKWNILFCIHADGSATTFPGGLPANLIQQLGNLQSTFFFPHPSHIPAPHRCPRQAVAKLCNHRTAEAHHPRLEPRMEQDAVGRPQNIIKSFSLKSKYIQRWFFPLPPPPLTLFPHSSSQACVIQGKAASQAYIHISPDEVLIWTVGAGVFCLANKQTHGKIPP